jgi:hypothetical protein
MLYLEKYLESDIGNIGYTSRRKTKQKHKTICGVGHHYAQTNTNNVDNAWALLQTTGGKNEPYPLRHITLARINQP